MLNFQKIKITDRDRMVDLLAVNDFRAAEYSFANALNWADAFNVEVAFAGDFLLIRSGIHHKSYLYPVGNGDIKTAIEWLQADAAALQQPFVLYAVLAEGKNVLEQLFPARFEFTVNRDSSDYIYLASDLIQLSGKKFQPKRNHISKFKKTFSWSYENITPDNLPECAAMNDEWCRLYGCNENLSLQTETCATKHALNNFAEEKLIGGLIRIDGKVIAYTVGEQLNSDTLAVHIEKAFGENFPGVYQVINQEFVSRHAAALQYVNREDDAGDAGLRKAKLSYHPVFMLDKYVARWKS